MILAHLPSGYILAQSASKHFERKGLILAACFGSIFPDIDLAYYWTYGTAASHHDYFTHLPIFWAAVCLLVFVMWAGGIRFIRRQIQIIAVFLSAVWLHLILDTVCGAIAWIYPISHTKFSLFTHSHPYGFWLWNELFSWTFGFELAIFAAAAIIYAAETRCRFNYSASDE